MWSKNLSTYVGQVANLRPIVNRLGAGPGKGTMFAKWRVANPPQVDNLPHMLRSGSGG